MATAAITTAAQAAQAVVDSQLAGARMRLSARQRAAIEDIEPMARSLALHGISPHNADDMRTARRLLSAPTLPSERSRGEHGLNNAGVYDAESYRGIYDAFSAPFDHALAAFDPVRAADAGITGAPLASLFPGQQDAYMTIYQAFAWQPNADRENAIEGVRAMAFSLGSPGVAAQVAAYADLAVVARSYTEAVGQLADTVRALYSIENEADARRLMLTWSGVAGTVKPAWEDGRTLDQNTPEIQLYLNAMWGWQDYQGKAIMSIANIPDRIVLIETLGYDQAHVGESLSAKLGGFGAGSSGGGGNIMGIVSGFFGAHEAGQSSGGRRILGEMLQLRELWAAASGIENPSWRGSWLSEHWQQIALGLGIVGLLTWIFWPSKKGG